MASYFSAARLRLILRLDEQGATDAPEPPARPPQLRTGKGRADSKLAIVEKNGQLLLLGPGDVPDQTGGPQAQTASDDLRTHAIEVLPSRLSISRNGIRTADTMSATIRFGDMPFDPRAIRACAVQAFVGVLDPEEASRAAQEGRPILLPDGYVDPSGASRTNLRFSGWVDEWETDFGDGDEPKVTLECTDNARLLIEQEAPPKLAISPDEPLDRAVAGYLSNFPQFRGLAVEYRPAGIEPPLLASALGKTAFKPKLGPVPGSGKLNVWDYLTDVCGAVGHVCWVDDLAVVIQRARTLYGSSFPGRADDPFRGRTLPEGRALDKRLFVYGRNVRRPRFRRKFARFAAFGVECRCYSPAKKRTLVARFPQKGDRPRRLAPGNAAEQTWKVFTVQGVESEEALRAIAQGIYETVGRNELEVEFETSELASAGGDARDVDALDARPGDPFELEVLREFDSAVSPISFEAAIRERPVAFLKELGFDEIFARAYAEAISNVGLTTVFRTKTVGIEWDAEEGVSLSFVGVNYIEVRSDKILPGGEEPSVADPGAAASPVDTGAAPF